MCSSGFFYRTEDYSKNLFKFIDFSAHMRNVDQERSLQRQRHLVICRETRSNKHQHVWLFVQLPPSLRRAYTWLVNNTHLLEWANVPRLWKLPIIDFKLWIFSDTSSWPGGKFNSGHKVDLIISPDGCRALLVDYTSGWHCHYFFYIWLYFSHRSARHQARYWIVQ